MSDTKFNIPREVAALKRMLGYDLASTPQGGRVAVNEDEAVQVRQIFEWYLHHGSLIPTIRDLDQRGWRTKVWTTRKEKVRGGHRYTKETLYKPDLVAEVKRKVGGTAFMASKGLGIRASRKPLSAYSWNPGEVHGHFWYIPNVRKTAEFPHVLVDVNYWKTFVHAGLYTAAGDRGCLSLFGRDGREHEQFAEHVAHSETWVESSGPSSTPPRPRPTT